MGEMILVEVAYATPEKQLIIELEVATWYNGNRSR